MVSNSKHIPVKHNAISKNAHAHSGTDNAPPRVAVTIAHTLDIIAYTLDISTTENDRKNVNEKNNSANSTSEQYHEPDIVVPLLGANSDRNMIADSLENGFIKCFELFTEHLFFTWSEMRHAAIGMTFDCCGRSLLLIVDFLSAMWAVTQKPLFYHFFNPF